MNTKKVLALSAIVFSLAAILHLLRIVNSWPLVMGTYQIPMSFSAGLAIVAGLLAYNCYKLSK